MRKPKFKYTVYYGGRGYCSQWSDTNWNEVTRFMKHIIDSGESIKDVTKEPYNG